MTHVTNTLPLFRTSSCITPCEVMSFSATSTFEERLEGRHHGRIFIRFAEEVKLTEEFVVYDGLSMVGEAGGYLGLFLGISCYQVILKLVEFAIIKKEKLNKITKRRKSQGKVNNRPS